MSIAEKTVVMPKGTFVSRWIPVSVIEDIKADIKSEYVSLRHRTDEDIELGECMGLKIALGIIDSHIEFVGRGIEPQDEQVGNPERLEGVE